MLAQKDGDTGPSELRQLRQLEEENRKLKRIVADLSLDKAMLLQAVVAEKASFRLAVTRETLAIG